MVKRSRSAAGFPEVIRQRVFILTERMFKAAELELDITGGSTWSFPSLLEFGALMSFSRCRSETTQVTDPYE